MPALSGVVSTSDLPLHIRKGLGGSWQAQGGGGGAAGASVKRALWGLKVSPKDMLKL
jgi:hypothetical protein